MKVFKLSFLISLSLSHLVFAAEQNTSILLGKVSQIQPGQISKSDLKKILGKPSKVVKLPKGESWVYKENGRIRVTFDIEEGDLVSSWNWAVFEGDSEQSLKSAMARFPGAKWEAETTKWINPHAFPSECYYRDKTSGISMEFHLRRQEVFFISRSDPSRKIAEQEEERPTFCIGESCSPAIPAAEFFKGQSVWKYCEATK